MSESQFLVGTVAESLDFVFIDNEVAVRAKEVIRHQICVMGLLSQNVMNIGIYQNHILHMMMNFLPGHYRH